MDKTENGKKVDQIQAHVYKYFKELGYRKRNRNFNQVLDSGLVHVINFQLGRPQSNLQGYFTVNLGVFIPEIHAVIWDGKPLKYIDECDCEIRKRLGALMKRSRIADWMNLPVQDVWWKLTLSVEELSENVLDVIKKYGVPYLNHFLTQDDIIEQWKKHGRSIGLPPRAGLSIAILTASQAKMDQAEHLLQKEYNENRGRHYADFIIMTGKKIGVSSLE